MDITQQKAGSGMAPTSLCPQTGGAGVPSLHPPPRHSSQPAWDTSLLAEQRQEMQTAQLGKCCRSDIPTVPRSCSHVGIPG